MKRKAYTYFLINRIQILLNVIFLFVSTIVSPINAEWCSGNHVKIKVCNLQVSRRYYCVLFLRIQIIQFRCDSAH